MNATNPTMENLFSGGPPLKIEQRLGLVKPDDPGIMRRAWLVILIGWVPLLVLTAVEEVFLHKSSWRAFVLDFGIHGRFLLAAPLFILAESACLPTLSRTARHFLDSGIVRDEDRSRFDVAVRSTLRLLNSTLAEVLTVALAYGTAAAVRASVGIPNLTSSVAGLWQTWVSLPLLLVLFFGWIWRQLLWCRFMWRIARLDLKLIAAHPDQAGGLKFLGFALRGYCPLALALATIVAGGLANRLRDGVSPYDLRFFVIGLVLFVLVLFVAPFAVFVPVLRRLRGRGTLEYGALSCAVGQQFEAKWITNAKENVNSSALEAPDFSATTDLYQIASNVYQIRYLPLHARGIGELIVFTLIPIVPLVLFSVPLPVLVKSVKQILL
jgi:hypothetical protein